MPIICRLFGCVHQLLLSLSASVGEASWAIRSCKGSHKEGAAYLLSRISEERNSGNLCLGYELFVFFVRLSIFLLYLLEGVGATQISDEHGLRHLCEIALGYPTSVVSHQLSSYSKGLSWTADVIHSQGRSGSPFMKQDCPRASTFCMSPLPHPSGSEENSWQHHSLTETRVFLLTPNSWKTLTTKVIVSSIKRMKIYQCLEVEPFRSKDYVSSSGWKPL